MPVTMHLSRKHERQAKLAISLRRPAVSPSSLSSSPSLSSSLHRLLHHLCCHLLPHHGRVHPRILCLVRPRIASSTSVTCCCKGCSWSTLVQPSVSSRITRPVRPLLVFEGPPVSQFQVGGRERYLSLLPLFNHNSSLRVELHAGICGTTDYWCGFSLSSSVGCKPCSPFLVSLNGEVR